MTHGKPAKRRRRAFAAVFGILIVVLFLLHRPLLTAMGGIVAVTPRDAKCDHVLIASGDRRHEVAAGLLETGDAEGVLLFRQYPGQLIKDGILEPQEVIAQARLRELGVERSRIVVDRHQPRGPWELADAVTMWLQQNESQRLVILCDQFSSRTFAGVLETTVPSDLQSRISLMPLEDRRYNSANWWTSRDGVKAMLAALLNRYCTAVYGRSGAKHHSSFDADEYQRQLAERVQSTNIRINMDRKP